MRVSLCRLLASVRVLDASLLLRACGGRLGQGTRNPTVEVCMNLRTPRLSPAIIIASVALFVALGGTGYAAVVVATSNNAKHLGGQPPSFYLQARHFAYSH